jgi:uncharacterized protein YjfI (DUF2170 family)
MAFTKAFSLTDALSISMVFSKPSSNVQLVPSQDHKIVIFARELGELLALLFGIEQQGGKA